MVDLPNRHKMLDSKPVSMPLAIGSSLSTHDGVSIINATLYSQLVGGL